MERRWGTPAALALLFAFTIAVYWRVAISGQYTWLESPDTAFQVQPWLDFQAREIHAGRLPLWDPYQWGGESLIGQVLPGVANPLNWILFALPLREGHIARASLQWYWLLIHWVAAALFYWLCRDLKAGVAASLLGASIFAFAGFMGHTDWPQFLMGALPLPPALMFFARVVRGERPISSAALSGAALGASFLGGHHNIPIYAAVLMGALWLRLVARRWRERQAWMSAALFLAVALLVSAVQVLPAVEYGRLAVRWADAPEPLRWNDRLPYQVHAQYSLPPRGIAGMVVPGLWSGLHANPFVGIVALTLALSALVLRPKSREVRLFAAVSLGGLVLALGRYTPVHRLAYEMLPLVEKARYPIMAIAICQIGIAALAALGLDAWRGRGSKAVLWGLVAFAVAVWPALWLVGSPLADWRTAVVAVVVAAALALVFWWGRPPGLPGGGQVGRPAPPAAVVALFLVEAVTAAPRLARFDRPDAYWKLPRDHADIARFLKSQPGWFRVEADEADVPYNFGDWFGIEQFGGYTAAMPEKIYHLLGNEKTPRIFGIRYRVARKPANPSQVAVFQSQSGLTVWNDPRIADPLWSLHPAQACGTPDRLRATGRLPGEFTLEADMACPGLVVTGDSRYPGWRAWVDGKRVPIQELEGAVRGVRVDAGRHQVVFRYRPTSVYLGFSLSCLGLMTAAILHRRDSLQARRISAPGSVH